MGGVGDFPLAEEAEGGVAGRGHVARGGVGAQAAAVFAERDIAQVKAAVFDAPVTAPDPQPVLGGQTSRGHTGDGVTGRRGDFRADPDGPFQLEYLLETWPVGGEQVARRQALNMADCQGAGLDTTVPFIDCACR